MNLTLSANMKQIRYLTAIALFAWICIAAMPARADSYYSSIGLGLPRYFVSTKAHAMGGAGIGVVDRMSLNAMNPAAINIQGMTTLGVNLEYEYVDNKSQIGGVKTRNGQALAMQFIVPVQKHLTLISMLRPLTSSRYTLSFAEESEDYSYTRTLKGNGGINAAGVGLQYARGDHWAAAAVIDFNFGTYSEEWKTDFAAAEFRNATDQFNSYIWGLGFDLGLYYRVTPFLSLGATYRSGSTMHLETSATLGNSFKIAADSNKVDVNYPAAFGLGAAFNVKKWLFAMDYYRQSWKQYELGGVRPANFDKFERFSAGIEFLESRSPLERYQRRIAYRLGGYYARLPFTNDQGEAVHEAFVSLGIGLPFSVTVGQVDVAIEVGKRGDVSKFMYEDTIFRLTGSIVGSERWFQRRY